MEQIVTKSAMLDRLHQAYRQFCDQLAQFTLIQLDTPETIRAWSVKDLIAHLIAHSDFMGADNWLLLDNRWVAAHPNQYHIQRPLWSNCSQPDDVDEVTDKIVGSVISEAQVEKDFTLIKLKRESTEHMLELPNDASRLPLRGGNKSQYSWNPKEHHLDAWVISRSGDLRC
jgi:hypothetical protein